MKAAPLRAVLMLILCLASLLSQEPVQAGVCSAESGCASVPLIIEDGRPLVEVTIEISGGQRDSARFLVDTGGGAFIIPESTARSVGLEWDETFRSEGGEFARPKSQPRALLAELELPLQPDRVLIALDPEGVSKPAIGLLPGHVLARHHVIFDYPGRTLTLAAPGSLEAQGIPVPMPVSQPMGFPRTEIEVAGQTYGMLLDTGPPATIISQAVMDAWQEVQPEWEHSDGAAGQGEALARAGGQVLETMVAENVAWAGVTLDRLTVAAQREGVFEQYISGMMTEPVVGALGSNAFMHLRLELDYREETLFVSRP